MEGPRGIQVTGKNPNESAFAYDGTLVSLEFDGQNVAGSFNIASGENTRFSEDVLKMGRPIVSGFCGGLYLINAKIQVKNSCSVKIIKDLVAGYL